MLNSFTGTDSIIAAVYRLSCPPMLTGHTAVVYHVHNTSSQVRKAGPPSSDDGAHAAAVHYSSRNPRDLHVYRASGHCSRPPKMW